MGYIEFLENIRGEKLKTKEDWEIVFKSFCLEIYEFTNSFFLLSQFAKDLERNSKVVFSVEYVETYKSVLDKIGRFVNLTNNMNIYEITLLLRKCLDIFSYKSYLSQEIYMNCYKNIKRLEFFLNSGHMGLAPINPMEVLNGTY